MQSEKKILSPLVRKSFDLQEAVVLLDVYLTEVKHGSSLAKAAELASGRLRALAGRNENILDDSFRSPTGLVNRLRSIGSLYEGTESKGAPGTIVFAEAVDLYKNSRSRYNELLKSLKGKAPSRGEKTPASQFSYGVPIEKAEEYLRKMDLRGATVKELIDAIQPGAVVSSTTRALDESLNVICMPGNRYVHIDSFVDLDEAKEELGNILKTHFAQFGGYSNNQLLFGAASRDLSMFLNDNDCKNIEAVFAIARFLFEKKAVAGKPYKFYSPHIFEAEPDFPMTLRGLMINLARNNGGVLLATEAKNYLQKIMLTYGGMGQLLQIGSANTFLMYDSERYLLSEKLGVDDAWCIRMHDRMDDLFRQANVAYVIPRDISTSWLGTLPALPQGLEWTHLLLQEVLDKYPEIGFRSISPNLNQTHDTLSAAFVPLDSPLQSFPDVVTLFMQERHTLPMRMYGEELRIELRDAGMLHAFEMIYALPKALDDYRFVWSNENKMVYVRGN